jgi:hypothetical protein
MEIGSSGRRIIDEILESCVGIYEGKIVVLFHTSICVLTNKDYGLLVEKCSVSDTTLVVTHGKEYTAVWSMQLRDEGIANKNGLRSAAQKGLNSRSALRLH